MKSSREESETSEGENSARALSRDKEFWSEAEVDCDSERSKVDRSTRLAVTPGTRPHCRRVSNSSLHQYCGSVFLTTCVITERGVETETALGRRTTSSRLSCSSEDCVRRSLKIDWSPCVQPFSPKSEAPRWCVGRLRWKGASEAAARAGP